jgi:hypothetical protein
MLQTWTMATPLIRGMGERGGSPVEREEAGGALAELDEAGEVVGRQRFRILKFKPGGDP